MLVNDGAKIAKKRLSAQTKAEIKELYRKILL
jgi:hypothetical protein